MIVPKIVKDKAVNYGCAAEDVGPSAVLALKRVSFPRQRGPIRRALAIF
jgi:hypothetical protein